MTRRLIHTMAAAGLVASSIASAAAAAPSATVDGIGSGDRYAGKPWASRAPVLAQHGMAATEQPLASEIAVDILKKGGTAVDAAIAANAALGLMEPVLNGIGGDCFVIVWDPKTHKLYGYNGSGPAAAGRNLAEMKAEVASAYQKAGMETKDEIPPVGSLPVTVPGTVDAWFALHDRFGKLSMRQILAPAIHYAQDGWPVTQLVAQYWQRNWAAFDRLDGLIEERDNARDTYLIDGHPPRQGEVFKNPDLARTLQTLANDGRSAFYEGEIAHTMADYFKRIGGDLRYSDFASFHGEWVTPRSVNYRGYQVYELPPNGQGFAVLEMLNILKGFDLKSMGVGSADALTAMIEAKRLAYADLAQYYADPKFVDFPTQGLLSQGYADQRREHIDLSHANADIKPGNPRLQQGDTTYFTVADDSGMMVSIIQSNYRGMGSGLVADHLGFMFQDRGQLFSLHQDDANVYAPGKRPFHTIIPGFVMHDDKPFMAFGLMGGDMQPQGHVQVLTDIIDFGMNVQEAGDAARWRHVGNATPTGQPAQGIGKVQMESGFSKQVKAELEKRGYKVVPGTGAFGGYQAIRFDPEQHVYWGATEMRKDGEVIGY
ncbi:gamma-glutamyltransferase [Salinisphaera sp. SPP-AMP-43]|uniref:gamma-glutamyltransferase n=1 Tax=Salinisphaera sp. SPP-AMP-43 TaxID=3121288 RepID=UPI003C6E3A92